MLDNRPVLMEGWRELSLPLLFRGIVVITEPSQANSKEWKDYLHRQKGWCKPGTGKDRLLWLVSSTTRDKTDTMERGWWWRGYLPSCRQMPPFLTHPTPSLGCWSQGWCAHGREGAQPPHLMHLTDVSAGMSYPTVTTFWGEITHWFITGGINHKCI